MHYFYESQNMKEMKLWLNEFILALIIRLIVVIEMSLLFLINGVLIICIK